MDTTRQPDDRSDEFVVGLLFDPSKKKVILIRKERPDWQKGRWNGPGGHVKVDEMAIEAVRREFEEETGVAFVNWQPLVVLECNSVRYPGQKVHVHYFTAADEAFWKAETTTIEVVQGFDTRDLPHTTMPNLRWIIPMAAYAEDQRAWPYYIKENER